MVSPALVFEQIPGYPHGNHFNFEIDNVKDRFYADY